MIREKQQQLIEWKQKPNRKPLIINGARQVGKTWLLKEFGKKNFKNFACINFEENTNLIPLFEQTFDIERILKGIQIETGVRPIAGETLIIFDEIQKSPYTLTSLKYFYENAPQYHVACAGSLLGIAMADNSSFPVGKVEFLDLYPLNFIEFLRAMNQPDLIDVLQKQDWLLVNVIKEKLKDLLRTYYYIGGMPEVVLNFTKTGKFDEAREIQNNILRTYELDFAKHAPANIIPRIRMLWDAIPSQLAKENKKFIYKAVKEGSRAKDYELALHWLIDAGLVYKINNLSVPKVPLKVYQQLDSYKLFMIDVGLLGAKVELSATSVLKENTILTEFKGSMTEQYVLQQLKSINPKEVFYWSASGIQSEVDFVVETEGNIWPIEVKAEENLQAKSLKVFHEKFKPNFSLRLSMSDFREQDWLSNIPLYAVNQMFDIIQNRNSNSQ